MPVLNKWNTKNLDSYTNCDSARDKAKHFVKTFPKFKAKTVGLYLWGANGTGKTYLVNAIIKELEETKIIRTGLVVSLSTLIEYKTRGWYDKEFAARFDEISLCEVLCVEEIGKEFRKDGSATDLGLSVLDNLVRKRLQMSLVTLFTSNLPPTKLRSVYSEDLASMLNECILPVQVTGEDVRNKIAEENKKLWQQ